MIQWPYQLCSTILSDLSIPYFRAVWAAEQTLIFNTELKLIPSQRRRTYYPNGNWQSLNPKLNLMLLGVWRPRIWWSPLLHAPLTAPHYIWLSSKNIKFAILGKHIQLKIWIYKVSKKPSRIASVVWLRQPWVNYWRWESALVKLAPE